MVRKIQTTEYLKRVDNMTATERGAYMERVGAWLTSGAKMLMERVGQDAMARLQNVLTVSAGWNDVECGAFEDGARLLTALVGRCETWLPEMLYTKSAARCVKQMVRCLVGVHRENGMTGERNNEAAQKELKEQEAQVVQPMKRRRGRPRKEEVMARQAAGSDADATGTVAVGVTPVGGQAAAPAGKPQDTNAQQVAAVTGVPVRPRHIDQYVHLLPKKTQERASEVKGLLRDLDVARENARRLMEAGEQGEKVAQWAKQATRLDEKVQGIYRELDAEWEELVKTGRVVVDIFGNASVVADADASGTGAAEMTSADRSKRRNLRKWLGDMRYGNFDEETRKEHVRKWKEKFAEYLTIEKEAAFEDKRLMEAAEHYGIDVEEMKNNAVTL